MIQRIAVALAILASTASAQLDPQFCDNFESIDSSSVTAFATNRVLACWQKSNTTQISVITGLPILIVDYEIRLQVRANFWMGMGLSSNNQMPNTDIYWLSYDGSAFTLQNRYASATSAPAEEIDPTYLDIQSAATDGNTAQVSFKRPIVGSGNRMSMEVSAYVLMATGGAPEGYHGSNKLPSASPIEFGTPATASPTMSPTASPTMSPTASPTMSPTASLTTSPTASPTTSPTASPTTSPTVDDGAYDGICASGAFSPDAPFQVVCYKPDDVSDEDFESMCNNATQPSNVYGGESLQGLYTVADETAQYTSLQKNRKYCDLRRLQGNPGAEDYFTRFENQCTNLVQGNYVASPCSQVWEIDQPKWTRSVEYYGGTLVSACAPYAGSLSKQCCLVFDNDAAFDCAVAAAFDAPTPSTSPTTSSPTTSTLAMSPTTSPTVSPPAGAAASSIKHNVQLIAGMVVLCSIIIGIV